MKVDNFPVPPLEGAIHNIPTEPKFLLEYLKIDKNFETIEIVETIDFPKSLYFLGMPLAASYARHPRIVFSLLQVQS